MNRTPLTKKMTNIPITAPDGTEILQPHIVPNPMPSGANPVPGLEIAGEVVATGNDAVGLALGDEVCGLINGGGYAEYCLLPAGS